MKNTVRITIFASILLAISFFTIWGDNGLTRYLEYQKESKQLSAKLSQIQSRIEEERNEVYSLQHSNSFLEKVAREELGLSRSGEIIYIINRGKPDRANPSIP